MQSVCLLLLATYCSYVMQMNVLVIYDVYLMHSKIYSFAQDMNNMQPIKEDVRSACQ